MSGRAQHALFPGTFDPFTLGHLDLAERALSLFGKLTVGVAHNADKRTLFTMEERIELVRDSLAGLGPVRVAAIEGLVVDAALALRATVLVRGVRGGADFDYEVAMARTNAELAGGLETVLLAPAPRFAHVSSSLVRQIALAGGDASPFVPDAVASALRGVAERAKQKAHEDAREGAEENR
jgi:pantetheine-phosphate adenylyltransferase